MASGKRSHRRISTAEAICVVPTNTISNADPVSTRKILI
ncbi:Unknown protein sequence [Pseudomonas savastanoi pv. glycinea]|nr:Unknown protein sequence [Pseudomonas savastanoi pv. glycinea]